MKKSSIVILAILKVFPREVSEYSSKDYYIRATVAIDGDGDKRGHGRTAEKNLFFDNANHKQIFMRLDALAATAQGDDWVNGGVDYADVRGAEPFLLPKPEYYYGYAVNYRLPNGELIERSNTKDGQPSVSGSINFMLIGERPELNSDGNVIPDTGWGETAYDEWMRMRKSILRNEMPKTKLIIENVGAFKEEDLGDDADDEPVVEETKPAGNGGNGQNRGNNGGRR